jgi:hypothetical protein
MLSAERQPIRGVIRDPTYASIALQPSRSCRRIQPIKAAQIVRLPLHRNEMVKTGADERSIAGCAGVQIGGHRCRLDLGRPLRYR